MWMALALLTIMVMQCPRPFYVQAEEAPISMVGSSLRLGDGIEVSFFFHPGQSLMESHDGAAIEFSLNGAVSETVTVEELLTREASSIGTGVYEAIYHVPAKNMSSLITWKLIYPDGRIYQAANQTAYTVRSYLEYIQAHGGEKAYSSSVNIAKRMMIYGGKAQNYFGQDLTSMTDASLTAADRDLSDVTAASLSSFGDPVISSSGISDRAIYYGVSLLLRDRVGVRAYFSFPQGTEGISVRDADLGTDLPITMVGNLGYVTLSDISFSRLGENRHIEVSLNARADGSSDGYLTLSVSPLQYCYKGISSGAGGTGLTDLLRALYKTYQASNLYAKSTEIKNPIYGSEGIDVSHWQGSINWSTVAQSKKFALMKIGGRGQSSGTLYMDDYFVSNMRNAKQAGVMTGAYFYSIAKTPAMAREEAAYAIRQLDAVGGCDLPLYMDVEDAGMAGLSTQERDAVVLAFCNYVIEHSNYRVGVYANFNWLTTKLSPLTYPNWVSIWIARYAPSVNYKGKNYPGHYDMWQYASDGSVAGVAGRVDTDRSYWRD